MKTPDLKPCPFCGGRPNVITWFRPDKTEMYQIQCGSQFCNIQPMTAYHTNKAVVVREWNRRVTDD